MCIHKAGSASHSPRTLLVTIPALVSALACGTDSLPTGAPSAPTEIETADVRRVASVDVTPGATRGQDGARDLSHTQPRERLWLRNASAR